jgi:hypothetical protein
MYWMTENQWLAYVHVLEALLTPVSRIQDLQLHVWEQFLRHRLVLAVNVSEMKNSSKHAKTDDRESLRAVLALHEECWTVP